jgi:two-component system, OmpR family, alkaline phosphatase synthesis response regulator PhoP
MMRILLVEDEESIRAGIRINLELQGYEVIEATDGKQALKKVEEQHFDLVILDVMLPEVDGFQVCERIRLTNTALPIIFLTAKDTTLDKITGLKRGADDYLTKPFALEELLLRVHNLLKRAAVQKETEEIVDFRFGTNWVSFGLYKAKGTHGEFDLTKKETMLLKLLIDRKNQVVSRQQILQTVWDYDVYPSTRTIDNFILAFRKYFEKDPKHPEYFHSIRGVGYKFSYPV